MQFQFQKHQVQRKTQHYRHTNKKISYYKSKNQNYQKQYTKIPNTLKHQLT